MNNTINLESAVRRYLNDKGIAVKALNFGRLKLKINENSGSIWRPDSSGPEDSSTRVVELVNNSSQSGQGNFSITKEGKPVITFKLTKGIVRGLPYRVKFPGPSGKLPYLTSFWAPVNKNESQIHDYTGLEMDTTVPLASGNSAKAKIKNTTDKYEDSFSCTGTLHGKVIAVLADDTVQEIPLEKLHQYGVPSTVDLEGNIEISFQNNHDIVVR